MKIHEYQAKELFSRYGIPTPRGRACLSAADVQAAIDEVSIDGRCAVKAQIHAGGRGKGGGVKIAKTADEARAYAESIMGMQLVTHQTGAVGQEVRRLLIEEPADIKAELYLGMVTDRDRQLPVFMASAAGGMDIEEVAAKTPEQIHKMWVSPAAGVDLAAAEELAKKMGVPQNLLAAAAEMFANLWRLYDETDASLVEINPLVVTGSGSLLALDGKITFDDNGLFRQKNIVTLRDLDEEDATEMRAAEHDLSYISLDGDIGCMVNGAGLAMATMDIIKLCGGAPANFLDVGGGASKEKVAAAFSLMLENPNIRAILINIFGGIMRCDVIAEGVTAAARDMEIRVPLVVRLEGTNVEQGKKILADSGLAIITADSMSDAAEKAVKAARG